MNLTVHIRADKGKASIAAHTCRAFKGKILCLAVTEVKEDTFGAEHTLRLLLPCSNSRVGIIAVKDALKVNVKDNVGKVIENGSKIRVLVIIALDGAHRLEEDSVILLIGLTLSHNGALGLALVQMIMIAVGVSVIIFCVGDQCLCGYGMDFVAYVVALNKRSFLWDVLWDYVEKFALKKEVDRK